MLEIQDLHVKFHNRDREAVSGVSLTIQDGEILGLVGESGSGKSVTAMSVAGLLPRKQCDYTGRILLDGQELLHADRSVLREIQGAEIGVVFQEPQSCMDPLMKIGPQVEETLRIHTQMPKRSAISGRWRRWRQQNCRTRRGSATNTPTSFPAVCSSGL